MLADAWRAGHSHAPYTTAQLLLLVNLGTSDAVQRLRAWLVSFRPRVPTEDP